MWACDQIACRLMQKISSGKGLVRVFICADKDASLQMWMYGAWVQGHYTPPLFAKAGSDFLGSAQDL